MSAKGRLLREFPGSTVSLNLGIIESNDFKNAISDTLATMSQQSAIDTKSKSKKAGKTNDELRDSTHPKLVTELFLAMLGSCGTILSDPPRIQKNTREEVFWKEAFLPWRRSPSWMLLRVTLQLLFSRGRPQTSGSDNLYKDFMVLLMANILKFANAFQLPAQSMHAMHAKIARRLLKLKDGNEVVRSAVSKIIYDSAQALRDKWSDTVLKDMEAIDLDPLTTLHGSEDVLHHLPELDSQIASISDRQPLENRTTTQPSNDLMVLSAERLPQFSGVLDPEYESYNLKAFEAWVAVNLDEWLESNQEDSETCPQLSSLISTYHKAAIHRYERNPEAMSIMMLTIFELWVACDKAALSHCRILHDYDPGFRPDLELILPCKNHLERLHRVEDYVQQRRARSTYPSSEIFKDFGTKTCFSVRYFQGSSSHQQLKQELFERATQEREAKRQEYRSKRAEYNRLMAESNSRTCDQAQSSRRGRTYYYHPGWCNKCDYSNRANALEMPIHEWPLPSGKREAQSMIFEAQVPAWFGHWRDASIYVLVDVYKSNYVAEERINDGYSLSRYSDIQSQHSSMHSFFEPFDGRFPQRVGLFSTTKPQVISHYRKKVVSCSREDDVCVPNGLQFRYYDSHRSAMVDDLERTLDVQKKCIYKLSEESSKMQPFLSRPTHAKPDHNKVVSEQCHCPAHLSLEEFQAFGTVPCGYRIQWQHLLLQLCTQSLDFKKTDSVLLAFQVAYQVSPRHDESLEREGHTILKDDQFCLVFLRSLNEALTQFQENWESYQALCIFSALARRVLSMTPSRFIQDEYLLFLSRCRRISFDWFQVLKRKAQMTERDEQRLFWTGKVVEIALVCIDTFNIESCFLDRVLSVAEDASLFIYCSIIVRDGKSTLVSSRNPVSSLLHLRWKHLSWRILSKVSNLENRNEILNHVVRQYWSLFEPGSRWMLLSASGPWIENRTAADSSGFSRTVHLNLLTGELLVAGLPLSRLPEIYEAHSSYKTLFGSSMIEVAPPVRVGFQFSSKVPFLEWSLHFKLEEHSTKAADLIIQAETSAARFELIPAERLRGYVPHAFVTDYVHWYHLSEKYVEFRPIARPWHSSSSNMILRRDGEGTWRLESAGDFLVSVRRRTVFAVSRILSPLVEPLNMHVFFRSATSTFAIHLPGLGLNFTLQSGSSSIQSREYRGMEIDPKPSLGTLVGLRNKLMLKDIHGPNRMILVPDATIRKVRNQDQLLITIDTSDARKAHAYTVNPQLKQLVAGGSLRSKLFLCYLHAVTSSCLADPLTGMTGTEQALATMRSAEIASRCEQMVQEDFDILQCLAALSPKRVFYPAHKKVMQKVTWSKTLSFQSQHGDFCGVVADLFEQNRRAASFTTSQTLDLPDLIGFNDFLTRRDLIRSSTFRVDGFGAEHHTIEADNQYASRDQVPSTDSFHAAFLTASLIHEDIPRWHLPAINDLHKDLWTFIQNAPWVRGSDTRTFNAPRVEGDESPLDLKYDGSLLMNPVDIVRRNWCLIHLMLISARAERRSFGVIAWLSTLAYTKEIDLTVIQALALIFVARRNPERFPPAIELFSPARGIVIDQFRLRGILEAARRPLSSCSENSMQKQARETLRDFEERQNDQYEKNGADKISQVVAALKIQWPCCEPKVPTHVSYKSHLDINLVWSDIQEEFKKCFENRLLHEYLGRLSKALQNLPSQRCEFPSPRQHSVLQRKEGQQAGFVSLNNILNGPAPVEERRGNYSTKLNLAVAAADSLDSDETPLAYRLKEVLIDLDSNFGMAFEKDYLRNLRHSLNALKRRSAGNAFVLPPNIEQLVFAYHEQCKKQVDSCYDSISEAWNNATVDNGMEEASGNVEGSHVSVATGQWPRLSPTTILRLLSRKQWPALSIKWRERVAAFALALTELQRAQRLISFIDSPADLKKELANEGHSNWDPMDFPESLLLEVESGLMIREVQEQIAAQMRSPKTGSNAVMQLNMGEGKSSVIMPIVAAALADTRQLVRVIVAKPQHQQMFEMLVSKLGGLVGRRIYRLPVSRALRPTPAIAKQIEDYCLECMKTGGILLVQPEHILSFQLMGLENFISGETTLGMALSRTQDLFDRCARDLVDESDENFSVKFELIYTMGLQQRVEYGSGRWTCVQEVLGLVRNAIHRLKNEKPDSMEVSKCLPGGFPRVQFLSADSPDTMIVAVLNLISEKGLCNFPIARQSDVVQDTILRCITEADLSASNFESLQGHIPEDLRLKIREPILILRGLFAGGVLRFALKQKRWRVDYGLDRSRDPSTRLAVPFRAKDSPSLRAEFSQPEVVLVLTCLSYYYGGLTDEELFLAFDNLFRATQANDEYQAWIQDAPRLPESFRQLRGINTKDRHQCIEVVFPHFRYAKAAIDYFLAKIVFPKEMREFPEKLSASGWDLARKSGLPTTGFSGTNDSRLTLPLQIQQLELDEQLHTNALVLEQLLQPENSVTSMPARSVHANTEVDDFIEMVLNLEPPTRVILDVGAQILELNNFEMAKAWLKESHDFTGTRAVVYFDDDDQLCVVDREGRSETLQLSPFAKKLDLCLVFLDEAHTRGTDLRLPIDYRAAVTLGPQVTKDRLVQGKQYGTF